VNLRIATPADLREMMGWFTSEMECRQWGGSAFRFPFTEATFVEDAKLAELPSFVLWADSGQRAAFGQYYLREGRCHLGRLAVSPAMRGRGIGTELILQLLAMGCDDLGVDECSLFVDEHNPAARRLYERLGFEEAAYPDPGFDRGGYVYMIAGWRRGDRGVSGTIRRLSEE
jgi:ribosomal protein S18 acetylase RimI-like enzyme